MASSFNRRVQVSNSTVQIFDNNEKIAEADTEDVARAYYGPVYDRVDFGLLPPGVRWTSADRRSWAVERPAGEELVCLALPGSFHTLPMPYRLLFITFNEAFDKVERLQLGFSRRPVQSMAEELLPFPGTSAALDIPAPASLGVTGPSTVGDYLHRVWEHLHMGLRLVWVGDNRAMNEALLPVEYEAEAVASTHPHASFVKWWAEQEIDSVCDWVYQDNTRVSLKAMIAEMDPPPAWTSTWEFFNDIVAGAEVHTVERRKREEEAAAARRLVIAGLRTQRIAEIAAQEAAGQRKQRLIADVIAEYEAKEAKRIEEEQAAPAATGATEVTAQVSRSGRVNEMDGRSMDAWLREEERGVGTFGLDYSDTWSEDG